MTTLAGVQAARPSTLWGKVLAYLRLGKARIYHHAYGWLLAVLLLQHHGHLDRVSFLAVVLILVGLVANQWAAGAADDIGGYRDGSDARNYAGRPARTVAKKPLITGALTEQEAVRFAVACFAFAMAMVPVVLWLLDFDVPLPALAMTLVAQICAVQYSTGLKISYRPLGLETQIFLTTGAMALMPYWAIAKEVTRESLLVSALLGLWFLLVVFHGNASDRAGDSSVDRKTLAVLLPPLAFRLVLVALYAVDITLVVLLFTTTDLRPAAFAAVVPVVIVHTVQQYFGALRQNWRQARFVGLVSLDVGCLGLALAIALS